MSNTLKITACDNQLIIVAYQEASRSFQLANIQSGYYNSVDVTMPISEGAFSKQQQVDLDGVNQPLSGSYPVQLAAGNYYLLILGLNWGKAGNFTLTFNGVMYQGNPDPQRVWSESTIAFTV